MTAPSMSHPVNPRYLGAGKRVADQLMTDAFGSTATPRPVLTKTIYVSIDNSDDKLTQNEWSHFYAETDDTLRGYAHVVHGAWTSSPTAPWQNANWCIEIEPDRIRQVRLPNDHRDVRTEDLLREQLSKLAHRWGQDSIAWAEATTEFITPGGQA